MIRRTVWIDGEDGTVIDNRALQGIYDAVEDAMQQQKAEQVQQAAKPTGVAAVLAGGLVAVGGSARVTRRGLLGLSWLGVHRRP